MPSASPFHSMSDSSFSGSHGDPPPFPDPNMPQQTEPDYLPLDSCGSRTYTTLETSMNGQMLPNIMELSAESRAHHNPDNFLNTFMSSYELPSSILNDHNWQHIHPRRWSKDEVMDWIYAVAQKFEVELTIVHGEQFLNMRGEELMSMSKQEFVNREPNLGHMLYDCLQELLNKACVDPDILNQYRHGSYAHQLSSMHDSSTSGTESDDMELFDDQVNSSGTVLPPIDNMMGHRDPIISAGSADEVFASDSSAASAVSLHIGQHQYPIDPNDPFPEITDSENNNESDMENNQVSFNGMKSQPYLSRPLGIVHPQSHLSQLPYHLPCPTHESYDIAYYQHIKKECKSKMPCQGQGRRGPGRPRKHPENGSYNDPNKQQSKAGRKPGQTSKGTVQLWKFIRNLLLDNNDNPRIIRWENKEDGVFRIVCSEEVARRWGDMKNNPSMTYEKMSRALRFCRDQEYFAEVPKDKNFPKKLCFRFGRKATGWQ